MSDLIYTGVTIDADIKKTYKFHAKLLDKDEIERMQLFLQTRFSIVKLCIKEPVLLEQDIIEITMPSGRVFWAEIFSNLDMEPPFYRVFVLRDEPF